jgi:4-amino-4-deoxy-L-arabinose transferase-like glycosyltransferase
MLRGGAPGLRLFLALLLFFAAVVLNTTALFTTKGEAREALVVQDMLEQGNYILPLRNGVEIPSKPPLFHWIGAGVSHLSGGLSEWAIRSPSVIFSLIGLLLFLSALKRFADEKLALVALLICMTSFEWFRSSTLARVDMIFAASLSGSLWLMYEMIKGEHSWSRIALTILLLTSALLSKGPAGLLLPFLIVGVFLLPDLLARRLAFPLIIALSSIALTALTLGGVWYLAAYQQEGARFVEVQLLKENVSRLTGVGDYELGHEKPFYMAFVELMVAFLPWSLGLPWLATRLWRERHRIVEERGLKLLSVSASLVFLTVCLVATSKRPVYFLGCIPFLAFLMADALVRERRLVADRLPRLVLPVLVAAVVVSATGLPDSLRERGSPAKFVSQVRERIEDKPLYQYRREYHPFLYYWGRDIPLYSGQSGVFVLGREQEPCEGCQLEMSSENNADEGRRRLALFRVR